MEDIRARHELGRADQSLPTTHRPLAAWSQAARETGGKPPLGTALREMNRLPVGERGVISFRKLQEEGLETPRGQMDASGRAQDLPLLQPTAPRSARLDTAPASAPEGDHPLPASEQAPLPPSPVRQAMEDAKAAMTACREESLVDTDPQTLHYRAFVAACDEGMEELENQMVSVKVERDGLADELAAAKVQLQEALADADRCSERLQQQEDAFSQYRQQAVADTEDLQSQLWAAEETTSAWQDRYAELDREFREELTAAGEVLGDHMARIAELNQALSMAGNRGGNTAQRPNTMDTSTQAGGAAVQGEADGQRYLWADPHRGRYTPCTLIGQVGPAQGGYSTAIEVLRGTQTTEVEVPFWQLWLFAHHAQQAPLLATDQWVQDVARERQI